MKYIILINLIVINMFGFTLSVNSGKDMGNDYYITHLEDISDIVCLKNTNQKGTTYICKVNAKMSGDIEDQDLPFMKVSFEPSKDGFIVTIVPKLNSKLIDSSRALFDYEDVISKPATSSRHFTLIMDNRINEYSNLDSNGINFPIKYPNVLRPSIGALDLNKEPLTYEENGDVGVYLSIKKSYEQGGYSDALRDATKALSLHPNSIFKSEFWLYYIRSLDKLSKRVNDYKSAEKFSNQIIDAAKKWMKSYGSDRNYPEVLYMLMNAYLTSDMASDANYSLDILMTEHPDSHFTKMAILSYADDLFTKGKTEDAIRLYEDVLYSSNDINIASRAAFKLAKVSLSALKFDEAKDYMQKVINANKNFILEDRDAAMQIAGEFRDKEMYDIASEIYKIIFEGSNRTDNFYEPSLRNLAITLTKTDHPKEAYEYLKRYQKEFSTSEYMPEISAGIDRLFFEFNDKTSEEKHEYYQSLMDKYKGLDIGKRALKEEVKLNFDEKKYQKVLNYTTKIRDLNDTATLDILNKSAVVLANSSNQSGDCRTVVKLVSNYSIQNDIKDKFKLFNCYDRTGKFEDAFNLSVSHIKDPDLNNRVQWFANLSKVLYRLGRYEEVIRASDEALSLAASVPYSDPTESIFYRFYSLLKLNRFEEAISSINALESLRGNDLKLVEVYDAAAKYAYEKGFDSAAFNYSKKTIDMQTKLNINTFSPDIDFIYISALVKISKFEDALMSARKLLDIRFKPDTRLRALYQVAEIYINLNDFDSAKPYISECLNSNFDSPWKGLCEQQKKLIGL